MQEILGSDMSLQRNLSINIKIFNCASQWLQWDSWGRKDGMDEASNSYGSGGKKKKIHCCCYHVIFMGPFGSR